MASTFSLPADSTVVIIGSYKGLTMELLDELYHPGWIMGYEPQRWASDLAVTRLGGRPNCYLFNVGLVVDEGGPRDLGEYSTDACSLINIGPGSREHGTGDFINASYALGLIKSSVDLAVINIEGYEFELLPYLSERGWLQAVDRLAIQFHTDLGNDGNYAEILAGLGLTHDLAIDNLPSWGYWEKKGLWR